jgi:hypothetical protein
VLGFDYYPGTERIGVLSEKIGGLPDQPVLRLRAGGEVPDDPGQLGQAGDPGARGRAARITAVPAKRPPERRDLPFGTVYPS